MKVDTYLDSVLTINITKAEDEKEVKYVGSGKLSASQLGWPLQWQILKARGIRPPTPDPYTLRKFARGNDVEEWLLNRVPGVISTQQKVEYRGASGRYDALMDTEAWDFNNGIMPVEIKSVSNAKFKRIAQRKETDHGHLLQGGLYALALGYNHFAIVYISTDDYRLRVHIHSVDEVRDEIDAIIDRFEAHKASGIVPVFQPVEPWQANAKYNMYPAWASLTQLEINEKLKDYELSR